MLCPFCNKDTIKTLETRDCQNNSIKRRKECVTCRKRFNTFENIDLKPVMVIKSDGSLQSFSEEKVRKGIEVACEKRGIPQEEIHELACEVIRKVHSKEERQITSKKIGLYILNRLKKLDKVSYMRFASVYRGFKDIGHFESELNKLQK
ncbi:MAG: transcriptional regulator NrdR [Candidatus Woesearchaeota archaeon]